MIDEKYEMLTIETKKPKIKNKNEIYVNKLKPKEIPSSIQEKRNSLKFYIESNKENIDPLLFQKKPSVS